ncbi:MAG: glycosyltransferase family 4 protein [Schwartzia succinivorans]|uniref:glycosyltransferase family 4 protein n=1 Tax=Schwartzia succinivorans TaxID=55507 RepID=UPI002353C258|nr:glycosyltransferase family 4 protein [Schwartzia succinivorans]MBE6096658.1 glycosyltransferase family 4 protein [Schwartzia succinivorans]
MKCAIFGTGKYAEVFSSLLNKNDICCYIDNDINKQGKEFNWKKIVAPNEIDYSNVDYIIVMVLKDKGIKSQLIGLGVDEKKIISYKEIGNKLGLHIYINSCGHQIDIKQWKFPEKKLLLMVHELSRTGVPVAAMHLAELLKELGYGVVIGSLRNGSIAGELQDRNIPYIGNLEAFYYCDDFKEFINSFDGVIMGTLAVSKFAVNFKFYRNPIFWWINETHENFFENYKLSEHQDNIFYLADGDKTVKMFKTYYPEREVSNLYYYLPEEDERNSAVSNEKICFGMVGSHVRRKGQDVLVAAIKRIPDEIRKNMVFYIIGPENGSYTKEWKTQADMIPEIKMIGELSQSELKRMYSEFDVLICPSRDDTVPIVVTQAFQNSIPCIVSNQVGQSMYMKNDYGGYVFESENTEQLSDAIVSMYNNKEKRARQGREGREIFEQYFSKNAVKQEVINKIIRYL